MEDNNDTGAASLDLAKAFNSISHKIFLKQAEIFNLSKSTILLFKSIQKWVLTHQMTINHGVP